MGLKQPTLAALKLMYPDFYTHVGECYNSSGRRNSIYQVEKRLCAGCKKPTQGKKSMSNSFCGRCMIELNYNRNKYGVKALETPHIV